MDERFPALPMLKWDHMMSSPPMFCHVVSASSASSGSSGSGSTKLLLGSHSSQEVTMLQYSGQSTGGVKGQSFKLAQSFGPTLIFIEEISLQVEQVKLFIRSQTGFASTLNMETL